MPTFERRDTVCDSVRALCAVRYEGAVEIIVVVDGSTDGTADALKQLRCRFPIRVIEQANAGQANARNRGAAEASGDIILFLDDDMMAEPDVLEQHAASYRAGADAVIGDFPVAPGSRPGFLTDTIADRKAWERVGLILSPFDIFSGHISVRRSVFEEIGGFDEKFTENGKYGNEDVEFGRRLLDRHQVQRNPNAISRQRTLVGPREYVRRARDVADGDLYFATKHPELAAELFDRRGLGRTSWRLRLLSRTALLRSLFVWLVVAASEIGLRTPFRSSRKLAHLFTGAYLVTYWAAIRRGERRQRQNRHAGRV